MTARLSTPTVLLAAAALLAPLAPAARAAGDFEPAARADTAPQAVRMVRVAPGVELEAIDRGGASRWCPGHDAR